MGQKILVVEDNELNLKLFCDLLRAHGFDAEPVRDGRDAVERARAFGPDLVVMDIQMPYVSGLELIELMKADDDLKRTPIMAVTAYAAKGDEERIRDAGAEGYVSKPISVVKFVQAVESLLEAARTSVAAEAAALPQDEASGAETAALEAAAQSDGIEAEVRAQGPAAEAAALAASADAEPVAAEALDSPPGEEGNGQDCGEASPSADLELDLGDATSDPADEPEGVEEAAAAPSPEAEAPTAGADAEAEAGRAAEEGGDDAADAEDPARSG